MLRRIFILFFVSLFILGLGRVSFAQNATTETAQESKAVNVGNRICPVTGEKISQDSMATIEYQGKIYNLCCSACIEEFMKAPEKYIEKVNKELEG